MKSSCNNTIINARETFALIRIGIAAFLVKIVESAEAGDATGVQSGVNSLDNLVGELNTGGSLIDQFNVAANACANWAGA